MYNGVRDDIARAIVVWLRANLLYARLRSDELLARSGPSDLI